MKLSCHPDIISPQALWWWSWLSLRQIELDISNAENLSSGLVGPSRIITTTTEAFWFVVSETTLSILLSWWQLAQERFYYFQTFLFFWKKWWSNSRQPVSDQSPTARWSVPTDRRLNANWSPNMRRSVGDLSETGGRLVGDKTFTSKTPVPQSFRFILAIIELPTCMAWWAQSNQNCNEFGWASSCENLFYTVMRTTKAQIRLHGCAF